MVDNTPLTPKEIADQTKEAQLRMVDLIGQNGGKGDPQEGPIDGTRYYDGQ